MSEKLDLLFDEANFNERVKFQSRVRMTPLHPKKNKSRFLSLKVVGGRMLFEEDDEE